MGHKPRLCQGKKDLQVAIVQSPHFTDDKSVAQEEKGLAWDTQLE